MLLAMGFVHGGYVYCGFCPCTVVSTIQLEGVVSVITLYSGSCVLN